MTHPETPQTKTEEIKVPGYKITEIEDPYGNWESTTYQVHDSMTSEFLFNIYRTTEGWKTGFTRQTYDSPKEVISICREKAIERLDRSLKMEVREIRIQEPDGFGDAFIVRNKESGNHYVVRPDHPEVNSRCECPDALYRGVKCKHQLAVEESLDSKIPSWKRQAAEALERVLEGEILTIDTAAGEANLRYEQDTCYNVNYLCTSRKEAASTKLIMSAEQLDKYIFDLFNPRMIEAFGDANPRFNPQPPNSLSPTTNYQLPTTNYQSPTPNIKFVSPDGYYDWEAINEDGEVIANLYYCSDELTQPYAVVVNGLVLYQTNTQAKAENYIIWHYKNGGLPEVEEEVYEPCTIEDCDYLEERGQQFVFRINNQMVGYIWLSDDTSEYFNEFWVNGDGEKYRDWKKCGLALAETTRSH